MNLYIKYSPLFYTYNTRIYNIYWLQWYLYINIGLWFLSILYLYIEKWIYLLDAILFTFLFLFTYLCFIIFYEIWYIVNDLISIKNEKIPTIRIKEKLPINFIKYSIIIRLLLWNIFLLSIYFINFKLWIFLSIILLLLSLTYYFHNKIRNYNINFFTIYILRLLKFSLIIIVLFSINTDYEIINNIIIPLFIYFSLFRLYENIYIYNERNWWINKLSNISIYLYFIITFLLLFIITKVNFYLLLIFFLWITFLKIYKKWYLSFKSNR